MLSLAGRRIAGLATLVLGALILIVGITRPDPFADTESYWAEFNSAQGLGQIDRDVRIAGVKVGTLGEVERKGDDVRIELIVPGGTLVHSDARVDMRPHTLFEGSNFVDLSPGSPSASVLDPGGTIPIEQTTNYVTLDKALRVLRPEIRNSLRDLAEVGSKTLKGDGISGVQKTLRGAPELTEALAPAARAAQGSTRTELEGAIGGFSRTVDEVAEREADLVPITRNASRTVAALTTDGAAPLDRALSELPGTLAELRETAPVLTGLVERLDEFATAVQPALPELALATREAVPVLGRAIPVLRDATPLIADTRLLADRLGEAEGGLLEMFNLLPKPLRRFDETLASINSETIHGAPAYRQLVAGGFTGFDGVFSGYQTRTQNPNAPGHALRIGALFTEDAFEGFPFGAPRDAEASPSEPQPVLCSDVRKVSPKAAAELKRAEGCS
ncbi:MAG: MlaD family protein [Solirubrobacterales bacterium]